MIFLVLNEAMVCHNPKITGCLVVVTTATILSLTILEDDAVIDLWRRNERYDKRIEIKLQLWALQYQSRNYSLCPSHLSSQQGGETPAVVNCVAFETTESDFYHVGDLTQIRSNPTDKTISSEKAKLSGTTFFEISASVVLGVFFCCHIRKNGDSIQVVDDDTTKTVDSLEFESEASESDYRKGMGCPVFIGTYNNTNTCRLELKSEMKGRFRNFKCATKL